MEGQLPTQAAPTPLLPPDRKVELVARRVGDAPAGLLHEQDARRVRPDVAVKRLGRVGQIKVGHRLAARDQPVGKRAFGLQRLAANAELGGEGGRAGLRRRLAADDLSLRG